jgi:ribosomal protein S18 acetylase RimI-like enzyme
MVTIIDFSGGPKDAFRILNEEWLNKYFSVEPIDTALLSEPQHEIIDKGGRIFYARLKNEIVGTAALLNEGNGIFELGKMAVTEQHQGAGIGKKLLEHSLAAAKEMGGTKVILYSNTKLGSAIHLYRKFGFVEVPLTESQYRRANIKMEKVI